MNHASKAGKTQARTMVVVPYRAASMMKSQRFHPAVKLPVPKGVARTPSSMKMTVGSHPTINHP